MERIISRKTASPAALNGHVPDTSIHTCWVDASDLHLFKNVIVRERPRQMAVYRVALKPGILSKIGRNNLRKVARNSMLAQAQFPSLMFVSVALESNDNISAGRTVRNNPELIKITVYSITSKLPAYA